jgi:large subunit ribosomal protein L10
VKSLAISKQRKNEVMAQYQDWLNQSQAVILVEYVGLTMKQLDIVRTKVRATGAEFHIVKNTLAERAFAESGWTAEAGFFTQSTAAVFAFSDAAATAKALAESTKGMEAIKLKGGFLDKQAISAAQVKALAELPPLPVMRATLLGVLQAPAGKLVRTLAEPARQVAAVLKAYSESPAAA